MLLLFCLFGLVSNVEGKACTKDPNCKATIFNLMSIVNKNEEIMLSIQNYLLMAFTAGFILSMQWARYRFRKVEQECDQLVNTPSDYAIILERLPARTSESDIRSMIKQVAETLTAQEYEDTQGLAIANIVMSYDMKEYFSIVKKNKSDFKKCIEEGKNFQPSSLPRLTETSQLAIVVFESQFAKEKFIYEGNLWQRILQCFCDPCVPLSHFQLKGKRISVQRAPEPDDIIWQNCNVSVKQATIRKLSYSILVVIALALGALSQYYLLSWLSDEAHQKKSLSVLIGTFSSFIVLIINQITKNMLVFSSNRQLNDTQTEVNRSLMIKISLFLFLNGGVFPLLANLIANWNSLSFNSGVLTSQATQIMIFNAILPNIELILLDYCDFKKKMERFLRLRSKKIVTQAEMNALFEQPDLQLPTKYAYVIKTLWMVAFLSPLVPAIGFVAAPGLIVNYWIEKLLHSRTYRAPNMVSASINNAAIELLEFIPFFASLGSLFTYYFICERDMSKIPLGWSIPIYLSLVISFIALVLPLRRINKKMIRIEKEKCGQLPKYEEVRSQFEVEYDMVNPAYEVKKVRNRNKNWLRLMGLKSQNQSTEKQFLLNASLPSPLSEENQSYIQAAFNLNREQ